ncbi:MAG: hypothetical protein CME40_14580 [Haliea sp.]|nr:hypothetical protein [Haliea sp.]
MQTRRKLGAFRSRESARRFAGAAVAQPYVGLDYTYLDADEVDLGALTLKGGYQLNDWAAVELRGGVGVDDGNYYGVKAELEHYVGGYFRAGLPNDSAIYPYVIAGYTHAKVKASVAGFSDSDSEGDFSWGLGASLRLNELWSANIEVMRYFDKSNIEIDGVSLGVTYTF